MPSLGLVAPIVQDYEPAFRFFVDAPEFKLVNPARDRHFI
jgi:hypothetical protein